MQAHTSARTWSGLLKTSYTADSVHQYRFVKCDSFHPSVSIAQTVGVWKRSAALTCSSFSHPHSFRLTTALCLPHHMGEPESRLIYFRNNFYFWLASPPHSVVSRKLALKTRTLYIYHMNFHACYILEVYMYSHLSWEGSL